MSLESRIHALETLLDPGSEKHIERECQARRGFAITLSVWESRADLPEAWRSALHQARQALDGLPPLPQHQCDPRRDERETLMRWLETQSLLIDQREGQVSLDIPTRYQWARFAPNVPIPAQQANESGRA